MTTKESHSERELMFEGATPVQTEAKPKVKQGPWESKTYYVKHEQSEAYGFFMITPEIGLLHIFCEHGTFTDNFADRWSRPGPDFKKFLVEASASYVSLCLMQTATQIDDRGKWRTSVERRLAKVMEDLWPLFIEQLKAELAAAPAGEVKG